MSVKAYLCTGSVIDNFSVIASFQIDYSGLTTGMHLQSGRNQISLSF